MNRIQIIQAIRALPDDDADAVVEAVLEERLNREPSLALRVGDRLVVLTVDGLSSLVQGAVHALEEAESLANVRPAALRKACKTLKSRADAFGQFPDLLELLISTTKALPLALTHSLELWAWRRELQKPKTWTPQRERRVQKLGKDGLTWKDIFKEISKDYAPNPPPWRDAESLKKSFWNHLKAKNAKRRS